MSWKCGKQQKRKNMEEKERGREGNGRGQNGGVIEEAEGERKNRWLHGMKEGLKGREGRR